LAFQSYPIASLTSPYEDELDEIAISWEYVASELDGTGQLIFANPQSFRWDGGRWPTVNEQRNMLYTTLLYGPKGILWYAFWDGGKPLPQLNSTVWKEVVRESTELATLTPFLLHGERTMLTTAAPRARAAAWELDGQMVVVVTNTDRTDAPSVSVTLPGSATGIAQPLFPLRDESSFTLAGSSLGGTIGPEEAHVYLVDLEQPGNDSPSAVFSSTPTAIVAGENAHFDASASSDTDGSVVSIAWDFGDGGFATGTQPDHVFDKPGTYAVRITVRDDEGASATAFEIVTAGITDLCTPAPRNTCVEAESAKFRFREPASPAKALLTWTWKGPAQDIGDFGSPTTTGEVGLCVYDETGLRLATAAASSGWESTSKGFRFKNKAGEPGGITGMRMTSDGTTSLRARARGTYLPLLDSPLGGGVVVQAVTSDTPACWTQSVPD
jgi:hypothetical protein